ncbi:MAG: competence/damage-inducible protein A [Verrucomicrobia bacterium]|nr:competence/damage-inducible protein A [Verrucomicrobiota bacterium]
MNIEVINTGGELMLGFVLNSHQQWLCRQLADLGYVVTRQIAIADTAGAICEAVLEALGRAELIIVTGGLGPTADDITREKIAELLGRRLHEDPTVLANIEAFFAAHHRPMPPRTRVQALVPDGAIVLPNHHGTAPGLAIVVEVNQSGEKPKRRLLVLLPGPPRELHPMFTNEVLPLLLERFPLEDAFACRILRTTGLGESVVEERIASPLQALVAQGLEVGFCAHTGEVDVRLVARGERAEELVSEAEQLVRTHVGKHVFGQNDDQLEAVIVRLLSERKQTLALAESCTGGFIAHRITNVPGASAVFLSGLVTYSNEAKEQLLGVRPATLASHGAVSEAAAREMAEGARARTQADYALAVTGIAGPTGGSKAKPVGTVHIALATAWNTNVLHRLNPYDRETFKHVAAQQALELLRQTLLAG